MNIALFCGYCHNLSCHSNPFNGPASEIMEAPDGWGRWGGDYIIANYDRKTHSKTFTGMFCTSIPVSRLLEDNLKGQQREAQDLV